MIRAQIAIQRVRSYLVQENIRKRPKLIISSAHIHNATHLLFFTAVFSLLFRDFRCFATIQFCVIFKSVGVLNFCIFFFFFSSFIVQIVYNTNKKKNGKIRNKRQKEDTFQFGLHLFDFRMCFSAALPRFSGLVYFWVYRCGIHVDGRTHIQSFVCKFISDTSHKLSAWRSHSLRWKKLNRLLLAGKRIFLN